MGGKQFSGQKDWRDGQRPRRKNNDRAVVTTRKYVGSAILTSLLVAAAACVVWILWWLAPIHDFGPDFVPLFVTRYEQQQVPPLPQAEADRGAIQRETQLRPASPIEEKDSNLTREVIQDRLDRLRQKQPGDGVVVYLATRALVDGAGSVQFLAYDSDPFAPKTLLPLSALLDALRQCPARRKLLVLDVMPDDRGSPLETGVTEDGVADLIASELARKDNSGQLADPHLAVLTACSAGEVANWSEPLHQSVFGHFFIRGLGDADADTDGDRAISLKELSVYLTRNVDRWARQHRGIRQRPVLLGSAVDLPLASLNRRKTSTWTWAVWRNPEKLATSDATAEKPSKAQEKDQNKDVPQGGDTAKKDAEKSKGKNDKTTPSTGKDSDEQAPSPPGPAYPQWLARGWLQHDQWAAGPELAAGPRLFRQLEVHLLRSERDWRTGKDPGAIATALGEAITRLTTRMEQALREKRPSERSVGQALAFGKSADPSLVKKLRDILEGQRRPDAALTEEERKALHTKMVSELKASLKDRSSLDLAMAIVEATGSGRLDPKTVTMLDGIVTASSMPRDVIELRLLEQLAQRAAKVQAELWDDELVRKVWNTVVLAEQANNRPWAFSWVRSSLDQADALRHDAEIQLSSRAIGFVSATQLARSWNEADSTYKFIDDCQTKIKDAQWACLQARAALPSLISYFEAGTGASPEELESWSRAAGSALEIENMLDTARSQTEGGVLSREQLADLASKLAEKTQQLKSQMGELLRPLRPESMKRLIRRCQENIPDARLGSQIEALFKTPLLEASDRLELWKASLRLDGRLSELPVREDDRETSPVGSSARLRTVTSLVGQRREWLRTLERMSDPGLSARGSEVRPPASGSESLISRWSELSRFCQVVHARVLEALDSVSSQAGTDHPGWIAPALLVDVDQNPIRRQRDKESLVLWNWLAARYRHESRDLRGFADRPSDNFFDAAALDCLREREPRLEPSVQFAVEDTEAKKLQLSSQQPETDVQIQLALSAGDGGPLKVALAALPLDDPRLRVSFPSSAELELAPASMKPAQVHLEWTEERALANRQPPAGFILQARLPSGRAFHRAIPVAIVPADSSPRLALRTDLREAVDVPVDPLRLRTLPGKQAFFVVVVNPSAIGRKVAVDIMAEDAVIATTSDKDKPPLSSAAGSSLPVPGFGEPSAKPDDPLPDAPPSLSLRLRDAQNDKEYHRLTLRPVVASPREYIEIARAQFVPPQPGQENRLEVDFSALPQMMGPPCHVRLDIPSDPELFPGFVEPPRGKLEGDIEPGGKLLQLVAEDIKLKPAAEELGRFSISVDGIPRALWRQTQFVLQGQAQKVENIGQSWVRFRPDLDVKPDRPAKLTVHFKVDNAPPDARLRFRLGQLVNGQVQPEIKEWTETARPRHVGFDPHGKGGVLLFEASIGDWNPEFDVRGIRGSKHLHAYLYEAGGQRLLDDWGMDLLLDDVPPRTPQLEAQSEIGPEVTRLPVKAIVSPPSSGIKRVAFILNPSTKGDFAKAEAENKTTPGKASENEPDTWVASLPVPPGTTGIVFVSVKVTSGVGLSALAHQEVLIHEPAPQPPAAEAKPAPPKPGAIEGVVTENDIKQPGLDVILYDPEAKAKEDVIKGTTKTAADGSYSFPKVEPGKYSLFCIKQITNRSDTRKVMVKPGETVRQDLDLLLH
jgi:hypothetical protein